MKIFSPEKDFAVIDVETTLIKDGEIPQTKFWGYADSRGYKYFATTRKLLNFLEKQSPKVLLHHANFDVIQLLVDGATLAILKSHNGKLIKCKLGNHFTQNTFAIFPTSMKEIFKAFGYEKTSLDNLEKRNYEDCVNGLECFLRLNELFFSLCGVYPLSAGTIAATGFKAAEIVAGPLEKDLRFLAAYRGGRVEVFDTRFYSTAVSPYRDFLKANPDYSAERFDDDCGKFDISSSYPFSFFDAPKKDRLLKVEIKTKDWHAPLFDSDCVEMLLFPNGKFTSWVFESNWQRYIEPLAEKTSIKKLSSHTIDCSWLHRVHPMLASVYEKKTTSTGATRLVCKLLINATYGRIGLKGESERARVLNYIPDGDGISCFPLGKNRWLAFDTIQREPRSNFPLAAFITDNARARLFQAFKFNQPVYSDTDSIFCRRNEKDFVGTIGKDLGDWNYEGRNYFCSRNVKDYQFGEKEVRKGGGHLSIWTLKRFAKGQTATEIDRARQTGLRKRIVLENGETKPHTVR